LHDSMEEMFEKLWARTEEKDWDFPLPVGWKPRDKKWRLWNE